MTSCVCLLIYSVTNPLIDFGLGFICIDISGVEMILEYGC